MVKKIYYKILAIINPLKWARKIGVSVGDNCKFNGAPNFGSEPWLIKIGNHTEISFGVTFITHDGATWCFRNEKKYKDVIRFGKIIIGDNCFIGANATILPNVTIGDDCIVGACSLVNNDIPSGEVWGGVPAKRITTTKEFANKCLEETPLYNKNQFFKNKKEEVRRICNWKDDKNE